MAGAVVLDHYQNIIEVGWRSYDYAAVPFGCFYVWYDGTTVLPDGTVPKWKDHQTFLSPPLFTTIPPPQVFAFGAHQTIIPPEQHEPPVEYAGKWGYEYITQIEQHISFGTSAKLRKKSYRKNASGVLEPHVEWVGGANFPEILDEHYQFPKTKKFAPFQFLIALDHPLAEPDEPQSTLEMYIDELVGAPVYDKDNEIVYIDGGGPGEGPSDPDNVFPDTFPYFHNPSINMYMWGHPYTGGAQPTRQLPEGYSWRVDAPAGQEANWPSAFSPSWTDVMAAPLGAASEFARENVPISGLVITVTFQNTNTAGEGEPPLPPRIVKYRQIGAGTDLAGNISILFERIRGGT